MEDIAFLGSLPPIQSAIKIDGSNGNWRIQIDVPATEIPKLVNVAAYCTGKLLQVKLKPVDE